MTKRCLHCFVRIHALFFSPPREIDSVCPSACLLASASAALALAGVHACERLGNRPTFCALAERATPAEQATSSAAATCSGTGELPPSKCVNSCWSVL